MLQEPIKGNNQGRNQFFHGANQGQNQPLAYQAPTYQAPVYQALVHQPQIPQPQVITTNEFTNFMKANDAFLKNMQTNMTSLINLDLELKNMFGQFMKMNTASSSGSITLPDVLVMIRVNWVCPMGLKELATWVWGHSNMGRSGDGLGTVQMSCRCTGSSMGEGERIVWVDIEGVPLHAWPRSTFNKIGSRWEATDDEFCYDDDSVKGDAINNDDASKKVQLDAESDVEGVSGTYFGDQDNGSGPDHSQPQSSIANEKSSDPFNLYDLLNKPKVNKQDQGEVNSVSDSSIPYPPRFTPKNVQNLNDPHGEDDAEGNLSQNHSKWLSSRVVEDMQQCNDNIQPLHSGSGHKNNNGGSILELLDGMVKVGHSMGLSMDGCVKDMERSKTKRIWIKELNNYHNVIFLSLQETKTYSISDMDIRAVWGNQKFKYISSEAVVNSGGILCVWDSSIFRKGQHVISDNFVALYGSWIPKSTKLLMISVYAPQSITSKRSLWDYISSLINRWNGDCVLMGDFNEVRCLEDRMGSVFNVQGSIEFNNFISNSGLVEIQLEWIDQMVQEKDISYTHNPYLNLERKNE
nr:RNA-directed DNA polymerase, eukaryota [Tanacetum cinerariifolium]